MHTNKKRNNSEETNKFLDKKEELHCIAICRFCSNNNNLVVRTIKEGKAKYYCKNCKKLMWNPIFVSRKGEKITLLCPKSNCGSDYLIRRGNTEKGKQIYECSECGKYTVAPKVIQEKLITADKYICACGGCEFVRHGFDRKGKQIYDCKICRKSSNKVEVRQVREFLRVIS